MRCAIATARSKPEAIIHSEGLRPSDSPTRSLAGPRKPHSARVGSLARSFALSHSVLKPLLVSRMRFASFCLVL
jgi:hypothetical protein